jgi:uncharacterized phage protein (predicted DNA packaging)
MLSDIKLSLRISNSAYDLEITDLIEEARHDLMLSGISSLKAYDDMDPMIKRAIKTYCKANFGFDNPDSDRLNNAYLMLKHHLSLAGDYQ